MQLLINTAYDQELKTNGYLPISFLNAREVKYLQGVYNKLHPSKNNGFYTTMNLEVIEDRIKVDTAIKELFAAKVEKVFTAYQPLFGNFTIKKPQGPSDLKLHLDWSVVDESKHVALGIWVPLIDVTPQNGAFGVLEGSHHFGLTRRGSPINFIAYHPETSPAGNVLEEMKQRYKSKLLCIPAGSAIIYDMRLAHFSPPNTTDGLRVACNLISIPLVAKPVHYYRHPDGKMETLQSNTDYYLTHNMVESPLNELERGIMQADDEQWIVEEQYGTPTTIDHTLSEIDSHVVNTGLEELTTLKEPTLLNRVFQLIKGES